MPGVDPSSEGAEQDLVDGDQTLSDVDQTIADLDQHAAEPDQAESDRAETLGVASTHYPRTRRSRASTALQRNLATQTRSEASRARDATADSRDRDADARDAVSRARDELAAALDADVDALGKPSSRAVWNGSAMEIVLWEAGDRKRAATIRLRAAEQRAFVAADRAMAQEDRRRAAADRRFAAEELSAEGMDHLTETLRRRMGIAAMQREIDRTARTGEGLVVAFVDVDGLKAVNDSLGHAAGDELLRVVARCIKSGLRPYDVVMRYGGDEIVCSLAGDDFAGIRERFDGIAAEISGCQASASVTVGLAERRPDEPLEALIDRADQAMLALRDPQLRTRSDPSS